MWIRKCSILLTPISSSLSCSRRRTRFSHTKILLKPLDDARPLVCLQGSMQLHSSLYKQWALRCFICPSSGVHARIIRIPRPFGYFSQIVTCLKPNGPLQRRTSTLNDERSRDIDKTWCHFTSMRYDVRAARCTHIFMAFKD